MICTDVTRILCPNVIRAFVLNHTDDSQVLERGECLDLILIYPHHHLESFELTNGGQLIDEGELPYIELPTLSAAAQ